MKPDTGFEPISAILPDAVKEIIRRAELWPRLEAECGRPLTDKEFLAIAEASGVRL
jgi:hypothetical protein